MAKDIELGFAEVLAGQVAVGLMPGDDAEVRARVALTAIGLMLRNATAGDGRVQGILDLIETGRIDTGGGGS